MPKKHFMSPLSWYCHLLHIAVFIYCQVGTSTSPHSQNAYFGTWVVPLSLLCCFFSQSQHPYMNGILELLIAGIGNTKCMTFGFGFLLWHILVRGHLLWWNLSSVSGTSRLGCIGHRHGFRWYPMYSCDRYPLHWRSCYCYCHYCYCLFLLNSHSFHEINTHCFTTQQNDKSGHQWLLK